MLLNKALLTTITFGLKELRLFAICLGYGPGSSSSALSRSSKIRRVMMAARRPGTLGERAGVIVNRSRPLIPVSAIPENIIAQAQVRNAFKFLLM